MDRTTVFIDGFLLDDIESTNTEAFEKNIEFINGSDSDILDSTLIIVAIQLLQSISFDVAYDILKYILNKIFAKLPHNKSSYTIQITCNKKVFVVYVDFEMTEEQKDKLVNAAIQKFLSM